MNHQTNIVNLERSTTAPLKNVALCTSALQSAINRPAHLPGLVGFYGPSGWGKSFAAAYAANKCRAYYVEVKSTWTKKNLLKNILIEMNIQPATTIADMADQVGEQLSLSNKPLIIDEMDHVIDKNNVEIIRDIYESSQTTILLIGEEHMETKLRKWERFHNRILEWVPAQPSDFEDVKHLSGLYSGGVEIADDLLQHIMQINRGTARRICVNIDNVRREAMSLGLKEIDLAAWGNRELYTGQAPKRRV